MTDLEKVLQERDGLTDAEREAEYSYAHETVLEMMEHGCSYDDVEEFMLGELGLEMDYIFDLL